MGQRHQCFIHMPSFSKQFYEEAFDSIKSREQKKPGDLTKLIELNIEKELDDKAFGTGKNTVLAYHHQWLYGRSAPLACLNVLDFLDMTNDEHSDTNPFSLKYGKYYRGIAPKERVKIITSVMAIFNDRQLLPYTRNSGIERFSFLNYDEPDMRVNFTNGDNNDGIFIIDAKTKKYCFMNIYKQDKKRSHSVLSLPQLTPCSAMDYIEAYYPSTMTPAAKEHIKWLQGKENRKNIEDRGMAFFRKDVADAEVQKQVLKFEEEMKENIKINKKFERRFKKYGILTLEEVAAMSPEMNDILVNHPELQEN